MKKLNPYLLVIFCLLGCSKNVKEFPAGYWRQLAGTNMTYTDCGVAWSIIQRIELKLEGLGYEINTNGFISQDEILELEKIQKENGIDSKVLGAQTLIKLGIQEH